MIDTKPNRDVIVVHCDTCSNNLRVFSSTLVRSLNETIEIAGWRIKHKAFGARDGHICSICRRKER